MLTEHFVASISAPTKPNTGITKDAGIFFHEHQPLPAQRHVFKKSASAPNGLAVSISHIYAAQEGKAVVHVYSREKGNHEATIAFPERIYSIALALKDSVLLIGTQSGRILAWEICSGRLVSTSTSHLQPVTSLAVDPTSNFFLSGSPDSMIHVWALPSILSFSSESRSPVRTLSNHRGPITSLICGHSASTANIAVSISQDKSAIIWDYHNGQSLRTYLLPETPVAITLDPADRAFFVAYEDGSLQTISFYDDIQQTVPVDLLRDGSLAHRPIQPPSKTRFSAESQKLGEASSLSLSWDGQTLISGHTSGKIASWDVAKGNFLSTITNLPGPVTNLHFLPPTGFLNEPEPTFKIHNVVKPKQDTGLPPNGGALVPPNYNLTMQFTGVVSLENQKQVTLAFEDALTHPSFPLALLEEGIAELESWGTQKGNAGPTVDFLSLSGADRNVEENGDGDKAHETVKELEKQLASLKRVQKATFKQLSDSREQVEWLMKKEKKRVAHKQLRGKKRAGLSNGDANGDVEMKSSRSGDAGSTDTESESNDDEDDDSNEDDDSSADEEDSE